MRRTAWSVPLTATATDVYLAALTAFVDHDALVDEMVGGLSPDLAERISDWCGAQVIDLHRTGGFSPETTERVIDPHSWPMGRESAAMIEATLAAWHPCCARWTRPGTGMWESSPQGSANS